ncbi:hypothetical protein [Mycoplasma suis]|uniref:Uncharacterized protein n=1 Tax=Mycoplasma suis (strain Illinois) TaxID=768700 RepID=F0QQF0_MYCSL|nr:hypothetical protein [Mycoplasma suis]ADX97720.1 hypothetical protein MSU_0176 [Mycoplasma suis str. Illinois]
MITKRVVPYTLIPFLFGVPPVSFLFLKKENPFNLSSISSLLGGYSSTPLSSLNSYGTGKNELGISNSSISSVTNTNHLINGLRVADGVTISVEEGQSLSLDGKEFLMFSSEPKNTINSVYGEVERNVKTKNIEEKSSSSLKEAQGKLTEFNENFEAAVTATKIWEELKIKNQALPESKREKFNGKTKGSIKLQVPLSFEQRKALFHFYKEFCGIKDKQQEYSSELRRTERSRRFSRSTKRGTCSEGNVVESLEKIGWNKEGRVTFGSWLYLRNDQTEKDPFSLLLEEEYLKKTRKEVADWVVKISKFKKGISESELSYWSRRNRNYRKYAEQAQNLLAGEQEGIENEMSMEIAKGLIDQMPQDEILKIIGKPTSLPIIQ